MLILSGKVCFYQSVYVPAHFFFIAESSFPFLNCQREIIAKNADKKAARTLLPRGTCQDLPKWFSSKKRIIAWESLGKIERTRRA
jgi:hypothetical protein